MPCAVRERCRRFASFEIEAERDAREKFEHDHFRSEPAPDRAELETDRAARR